MKTTLKVLTLTGLLTVGGLTSCSQTFEETPQPTTPTTPTSPTSGTVTLMPGQTVTGIDGVQITAPKEIEGWDGKPIQVFISKEQDSKIPVRPGDKLVTNVYKIFTQSPIRSGKISSFTIDLPKRTLIENYSVLAIDNRKSDLIRYINYSDKVDFVRVYTNVIGESSYFAISEDAYKWVNRKFKYNLKSQSSNSDILEVDVSCRYRWAGKLGFGYSKDDCDNIMDKFGTEALQNIQEFSKVSGSNFYEIFNTNLDNHMTILFSDNTYVDVADSIHSDPCTYKTKNLDSRGSHHNYGGRTIHICQEDPNSPFGIYPKVIRHELFHALQYYLGKDNFIPRDSIFMEGSARSIENSSTDRMEVSDFFKEKLDFTEPLLTWNYDDTLGYPFQDFWVYFGKSSETGYKYLVDLMKHNQSLESLVNQGGEPSEIILNRWWKFNLDRAIENKYPLRSDDLRCQVNKEFIEPKSISWNLSVTSKRADISVGSYDTDYSFYKISGEGAKDITVTPASNFKVGQDSIRAAVYLRTGEGSDVTCNSIAPQADGTYKIPNVKAGDQILLAAGNLKEVANPVNLGFTLTTAVPASYKRVKVNFGKALYYDNAPSPLSESARRGGKVYAQDFGRSMAISENEFWIDTNGLASGEKPSIGVEPLKGFTLDNSRITGTCEVTYAPSSRSLLFNNLKDDCEINLQFRFQVSDFKLDCPREVYGIGHAKYPGEQSCNAIAYGKSDYYDGPLAPQPPIEVYAAPANIVELTPSSSPTRWLITPQNNGTVTIGATIYDSSYGNNDRQSGITNSNEVVVQSHVRDEIPPLPYTLSNVTLTCLPGQIEVNTSRDVCTATAIASDGTTAKDVTNEATFEFSPVNSAIATITNSDQQWIGKVTGVSAGEARFTVTATWNGERRTSAESGAVQIVAPTPVIDPALQGTAEITVIDAATAAPVSSVVFKACTTTGNCTPVTTREQSPGVYVLALQEGTYTLQVSREGYLPATMQNVAIVRGQKTILERHLILDKTIVGDGTIRGRLLNAVSGAGVANVKLDIRQELYNATGAVVTTVTTDSEGRYSLNLPTGYYTATATREGYLPVVFNLYAIGGKVVDLGDRAMSPVLAATGDWRVVLTWGASPSDLDSHLTGPTANGNRFHVYFYNPSYQDTSTNVLLDRDDTSSYGPETTTIKSTTPGLLKYSVHDYSNRGYSGSALSNSGAKVELYRGSSAQALATFYVPAGNGDLWTVFTIDTTNPQAPKITPINTITTVGGSSSVQSVPNPNVEQQKSGFDLRSPLW